MTILTNLPAVLAKMNEPSNKLKSCPFCGEEAKEICYPTLAYIECEKGCCQQASWGPESTGKDGIRLNGLGGIYWCDILREKWNARADTNILTAFREAMGLLEKIHEVMSWFTEDSDPDDLIALLESHGIGNN